MQDISKVGKYFSDPRAIQAIMWPLLFIQVIILSIFNQAKFQNTEDSDK